MPTWTEDVIINLNAGETNTFTSNVPSEFTGAATISQLIIPNNGSVTLQGNAELKLPQKAWSRVLTPADIAASNVNGSQVIEVDSSRVSVNFLVDDVPAIIALGIPYDIAGGDVHLDTVHVYYKTDRPSSYIQGVTLRKFTPSGTSVNNTAIVSNTTAYGSGNVDSGKIELSITTPVDIETSGLQIEIEAKSLVSAGDVKLKGILLEGHTE